MDIDRQTGKKMDKQVARARKVGKRSLLNNLSTQEE